MVSVLTEDGKKLNGEFSALKGLQYLTLVAFSAHFNMLLNTLKNINNHD